MAEIQGLAHYKIIGGEGKEVLSAFEGLLEPAKGLWDVVAVGANADLAATHSTGISCGGFRFICGRELCGTGGEDHGA